MTPIGSADNRPSPLPVSPMPPDATPRPTGEPSPTASAPSLFPVLELGHDDVKSLALPEDWLTTHRMGDADGYGPRMVFVERDGRGPLRGQQVFIVDLDAGEWRPLNELRRDVITLDPRISGDDVVWTADRDIGRTGKVAWEIVHHDLSTGVTEVIDQGTNTRLEDGSANTPALDLDDGLVAYAIESPTPDRPWGWTIVIRRLADGAVERRIDTQYSLWDITLDDGNVMYTEGPIEEDVAAGDAGVKLSTIEHPSPVPVAGSGWDLALDGQRLVWSRVPDTGAYDTMMVLTATVDDMTPIVLSGARQDDFSGRFATAGDGLVAWNESREFWDELATWDSSSDRAVRVVGYDNYELGTDFRTTTNFLASAQGGWLTWTNSLHLSTPPISLQMFSGVPIDLLRDRISDTP